MPRVVIFGPSEFGGAAVADKKVEQAVNHIVSMIVALQKNTIVGRQTEILIATYQCFLGINTPFFHADPTSFNYRPKHSILTFVWEELHKMQGTISSANWWLPTTNFDSDPPIMSSLLDAQSRARNTPHAISDKMIRHANLVRLFLRATFLSDILNTDMTSFADWALAATRQRQTSETYPTQAPPFPQMLQQWKPVLRQAFIKTGHTLNFKPTSKQVTPRAQPPDTFTSFLQTRPE